MKSVFIPVLTAVMFLAPLAASAAGAASIPKGVPVYGKFEMDVRTDLGTRNPYDPNLGSIEAVFTAPSGKTSRVPAFWYVPFNRTVADGYEYLEPRAGEAGGWRVRFTPTEKGQWKFSISSITPKGTKVLRTGAFEATPSTDPGFVRVSTVDPRYFAFDDGTAYYPIGENLCWYRDGKTADYDKWMARLKENGVNYIRLWMGSWSFALEWNDTGLGNYENRQDRAFQLDHVLSLAEKHGMKIMLCLNNHGLFSAKTNPEWANNPYNTENGGFLDSPLGFFVNKRAKDLFKRRLSYIIARWGYSTALHSWELFNEVDLVDGYDTDIMAAWHDEMAEFIRKNDPYRHLISTSFSDTNKDPAIWGLDTIDYTQTHFYRKGDMPTLVKEQLNAKLRFNKPTFIGEYALNWTGEGLDTEDPTGIQIHQGQWGSLMSSAGGGAMLWWWDNYVDPHDLYFRFKGAAMFAKGIDWPRRGFKPAVVSASGSDVRLKAQGLAGKGMLMAWVRDSRFTWDSEADGKYEWGPITGASLAMKGVEPGEYALEWWNTETGEVIGVPGEFARVTVGPEGVLGARVPEFLKDIAMKAYLR